MYNSITVSFYPKDATISCQNFILPYLTICIYYDLYTCRTLVTAFKSFKLNLHWQKAATKMQATEAATVVAFYEDLWVAIQDIVMREFYSAK